MGRIRIKFVSIQVLFFVWQKITLYHLLHFVLAMCLVYYELFYELKELLLKWNSNYSKLIVYMYI